MEDAHLSLQVTLVANGFAQRGRQPARVDDRIVLFGNRFRSLAVVDMKLAWSVTALAADRRAVEDRRPVTVHRLIPRVRLVAVTEQALHRNGPIRVRIAGKSRR